MLNSLTAQVISVIVMMSFFLDQQIFIDIAILYALTSFIANAVFLKINKGN
jgi:multisubunit Na+/H+ antiporter MnhF subunit